MNLLLEGKKTTKELNYHHGRAIINIFSLMNEQGCCSQTSGRYLPKARQ